MKKFTIVLLAFLSLGSFVAEAQTWRSLSGANPYVHRIMAWQNPTLLIACADSAPPLYEDANAPIEFFSGEGYRVSTDDGASWSESKLDGFSVRDIVRLPGDNQTWIAAVIKPRQFTGGTLTSLNAGNDWPSIAENDLLMIEQLHVHAADTVEIYAGLFGTSQGFQVSKDTCHSWSDRTGSPVSYPISTRAMAFSPLNDSLVLVGGDGRGLPGVLHSTDLGMTWQKDTVGLGGKRILCVMASRHIAGAIYCGTDSITDNGVVGTGIYKSADTGSTWFRLGGSEGKRVWQIIEHPVNPAVLLAAADSAGILASGNYGHGWEPANDGLPAGVVVRTLTMVNDALPEKGIAAYAGTYGHGVYKSSNITTGIAEIVTPRTEMIVAPSPASDVATVMVPFATTAVTVVDITGSVMLVATPDAVRGPDGSSDAPSYFRIQTSMLPQGSYRVIAQSGQRVATSSLVVIR